MFQELSTTLLFTQYWLIDLLISLFCTKLIGLNWRRLAIHIELQVVNWKYLNAAVQTQHKDGEINSMS